MSCLKCVNDLPGSLAHSEKPLTFLQFPRWGLRTEADAEASFRHFPRGVNKISIFFSLPFVVLCFVWLVAQIKDKANEEGGGRGWGNWAHYATKYSCDLLKTLTTHRCCYCFTHARDHAPGKAKGWGVGGGVGHNYQITFRHVWQVVKSNVRPQHKQAA